MIIALIKFDIGGVISGLLGIFVGIMVLAALIAGFFMWIGAKMAGVENATFGKAIWAAIATSIVTWLISALFSIIPGIGTIIGFFVGLLFSIGIIKSIFNTTGGKAFLVWIFNIVAQVIAIIIAIATFASALGNMF